MLEGWAALQVNSANVKAHISPHSYMQINIMFANKWKKGMDIEEKDHGQDNLKTVDAHPFGVG